MTARHGGWPYPRIIGHRGGGTLAPENTLAGIRTGAARGCTGVEFDVMLSADGVPLLIHDETLDRTTSGSGVVSQTAWAVLTRLDAGRWFNADHAGEPLPAYADAVRLCRELGLWANVEIKPARGFEVETGQLVAQRDAALWQGAPLPPLYSSFSIEALQAARTSGPDLALGWLVDAIPSDWQQRLQQLGCVSLHCNYRKFNATLARAVKQAGYGLLCYTVNDAELARTLFGWGVDAVVTDRPDLVTPNLVTPNLAG